MSAPGAHSRRRRRTAPTWAVLAVIFLSCRAARGPDEVAQAYAAALREGRLDDAHALTPSTGGESLDAFRARYASEETRKARAAQVEASRPLLVASAPGLWLMREGEGWRVREEPAQATEVLRRFIGCALAKDFECAYPLLASPLRARYTPRTLAADFEAEPAARDRLARALSASEQAPQLQGVQASFPIGEGKAIRLVLEGTEYKVAALE